jgi:hypothetical protein
LPYNPKTASVSTLPFNLLPQPAPVDPAMQSGQVEDAHVSSIYPFNETLRELHFSRLQRLHLLDLQQQQLFQQQQQQQQHLAYHSMMQQLDKAGS